MVIFGNSIFSHVIAKTASACDARMGGAFDTSDGVIAVQEIRESVQPIQWLSLRRRMRIHVKNLSEHSP